jgi:hypothetical protein
MTRWDPDELLAAAAAATGLDDFGPDDFRPGLDAYCGSLGSEAMLSEIGELAVRSTLDANLAQRLRVLDWHRSHPHVASETIERPLVVIGMFRAGTTLLSNLLDQDPANRSLLRWESADAVPPVGPDELRANERVDLARAGVEMLEALNPRMAAVHHEDADGPTEDIAVMSQDFKSLSWEAIANVPTYSRWLLGVDQTSAYEHHRKVLQVLQSAGARGRWTLKSPHHALALDELLAVYPDARLALLHRDPVVLCASVCSLVTTLSGTFSDADHRAYIAEHWVAMLEEMVRRIDAFRDAHPEHAILDVQYADLVRDPVGTVRAIEPALSDDAAARIEAYVAAHPKGSRGEHHYDLADLGLDGPTLRDRFAGYATRYEVPAETV